MKRLLVVFMTVVCLVGFSFCGAAEETDMISRIRNAVEINWASEDFVVLDGQMIRVSDGEILFDKVWSIVSTGGYAWIDTADDDGIYIMDKTGGIHLLRINPDDRPVYCENGKYGLFWGTMGYNDSYVYDPALDQFILPPTEDREILEIYQDSEGQTYILTESKKEEHGYTYGIYKANGMQILKEGKYRIASNCNNDYITNEYLTACDQNCTAVIISPFTGQVINKYPGFGWVPYDSNHMIFRDNTALIGPLSEEFGEISGNQGYGTKIIGLDGSVLKELPDGYYVFIRGESDCLYGIGTHGEDGCYNVVTDRTYWYDGGDSLEQDSIICEETGETFKRVKKDEDGGIPEYQSLKTGETYSLDSIYASGTPIPERYEKYRPVQERLHWPVFSDEGIGITAPDGTLLGKQYWREIAWDRDRRLAEDIGGFDVFADTPVCAVEDENELYAVYNIEGDMILPSEYEQIDLIGSFSDNPKANGYCLAAKKNGQWYIFNIKGELLYDDADSQSKEEPVTVSGMPVDQESDIPALSEQFPGKKAGLRKLGGQEKVTLFAGPGNHYPVIRKINPNESNTTTAYFIEDDMVFVHYVHRFVDTYGYMKKGAFAVDALSDVPEINELKYVSRKSKDEILPLTGPGEGFEKWTGPAIPEGSDVRCYFTEDGYSFIEYDSGTGLARAWVDLQVLSQEE